MRNDFLQELADGLRGAQTLAKTLRKSWFPQFLETDVVTDNGRYSFEGHEPLRGIAELLERIIGHRESDSEVNVFKGEQLTVTTLAIGLALWTVADHGYNVGYFLPDDDFANMIGATRVTPIINGSEYLTNLMMDADVDRGVLKQIADKYLYIIGLGKVSKAVSRPMDFQISDEVDLTPESVRKWKRGRMRHSKLRCEFDFSAPYSQDSGIDARYERGSQRRWLVKCVSCGHSDICLEEAFPECVRIFGERHVLVCPKCKRKLDAVANGQWVAAYPSREKDRNYSFRLSAFPVTAMSLDGIMSDYRKALDDPEAMAIFDRTVRAIANGGSLQPITEVELRRMKQGHDYALSTSPSTAHPRFFGVDCGNACWFWCEEWLAGEKRARLVWAEKINSDRLVERVSELIRLLQPRFGIVDARPLLDAARKIAYLHPDHVALQEFVNGRELTVSLERHTIDEPGSANAEYGPEYRLVQVDRNTSLDQFCAEAKHPDRGLILPNEPSKIMTDVGAHLKKLQKQRTRNAAGNVVDKFVEKVANHLGMAASSARLARLVAPTVLPYIYRPSAHVPRSFGFKGAFV